MLKSLGSNLAIGIIMVSVFSRVISIFRMFGIKVQRFSIILGLVESMKVIVAISLTFLIFVILIFEWRDVETSDFINNLQRIGKVFFIILFVQILVICFFLFVPLTQEQVMKYLIYLYPTAGFIWLIPIVLTINLEISNQTQSTLQALLVIMYVALPLSFIPESKLFYHLGKSILSHVVAEIFDLLIIVNVYIIIKMIDKSQELEISESQSV